MTLPLPALLVVLAASALVWEQTPDEIMSQRAEYDALVPKSILQLQPFRRTQSGKVAATGTKIELLSLNPNINSWFLLTIDGEIDGQSYHLENPDPDGQQVWLEDGDNPRLALRRNGNAIICIPWKDSPSELEHARASGLPFAPICNGQLYLRNSVSGSRTSLEMTTDFLRDHVWGGEAVVRFFRENFFQDSHLETGSRLGTAVVEKATVGPEPALLEGGRTGWPVIGVVHDFALSGAEVARMTAGMWYPVSALEGVFVSALQPRMISPAILNGPGRTNPLDSVEAKATAYFVAFDLSLFDLGFALGTDHPRLDWSPRPPDSVRVKGLPGPDGVSSARPLVLSGMVSPAQTGRTIATFTGGFKRTHGAFKWGSLSTVNQGTHYGFIEHGTVFSKLQPGLSTLFVLADGRVRMKTWGEDDNALLPDIRFARQNGVPILEFDPVTGLGVPGELVTAWGPGNWSGSAQAELRTLRAGACIVTTGSSRYLVYGYFSTATPSAMARGFQAYGCRYAMLLDMNALEHTYLALYVRKDGKTHVEHIVPGMALVDRKDDKGNFVPRFLGFPDNRDLFYLTEKGERR